MTESNQTIHEMFEQQFAYLNSGKAEREGSRAIAAGRAAGLAWDDGQENLALAIWQKEVAPVTGMPSFAEFRAGYKAHVDDFGEFADRHNYPAIGTAFSNAAGSYAYALDNAVRGAAALAGGEAQWAGYWGAKALQAAGFPAQAEQLDKAIQSGTLLAVPAKGFSSPQ